MKKLLAFCSIILLTSCHKGLSVPDNVIPQARMEKILWDMVLADRYAAQFLARDTSIHNREARKFELYEKVFRIHKINREKFTSSMRYYLSRPDLTSEIFDTLSARASRNKSEMYKPVK